MLSADILSAINDKLDVLVQAQKHREPPAFPSGLWQTGCYVLGQLFFWMIVSAVLFFVGFYMYAVIRLYFRGTNIRQEIHGAGRKEIDSRK